MNYSPSTHCQNSPSPPPPPPPPSPPSPPSPPLPPHHLPPSWLELGKYVFQVSFWLGELLRCIMALLWLEETLRCTCLECERLHRSHLCQPVRQQQGCRAVARGWGRHPPQDCQGQHGPRHRHQEGS